MFSKLFLNIRLRLSFFYCFFLPCFCLIKEMSAQTYAPPVGQNGSTAIYKDSSVFVAWANQCAVTRGFQDISTPSLGLASAGNASLAIGKADGAAAVSLGDGGVAICQFFNPITNGSGFDFAIFENGFNNDFLELAFVEVSSDGVNYFRFASHSLSDTLNQCGTFGNTDATKINNLAGKYRGGYGTPFDLQELAGKAGLNINSITHVKIIDVVGSLNKSYASYDSFGNKINDPWPTPFPQGGFDLDAIGVIHQSAINGINENKNEISFSIYPNPIQQGETVFLNLDLSFEKMELFDVNGRLMDVTKENYIQTHHLSKGIYYLNVISSNTLFKQKLVIF